MTPHISDVCMASIIGVKKKVSESSGDTNNNMNMFHPIVLFLPHIWQLYLK